jgi:hypothetical protein
MQIKSKQNKRVNNSVFMINIQVKQTEDTINSNFTKHSGS